MATMTKRQEVLRYCGQHDLKACGKGGVPMLSCWATDWVECFDTWGDAHAFLCKAKDANYVDRTPFPWAARPVK